MTQEHGNRGSSPNAKLVWLVAASFLTLACCVIVRVGIGNTPYDTVDSQGRRMGFNDVFSLEHYTIILSNFSIFELFDLEYAYEWVLLLMYLIAVKLLFDPNLRRIRLVKAFFAAQLVLFPFSIPGFLMVPSMLFDIIRLRADREFFIDVPFIAVMSHPTWVVVSLVIAFMVRLKATPERSS